MCQLLQKSLKIIKEQKSSEWEVVSDNDMHAKCSKVYYTHLIQKGMQKHVKHHAEWKSWHKLIIDIGDVTDVYKWELLMEFKTRIQKKLYVRYKKLECATAIPAEDILSFAVLTMMLQSAV